MVDRERIDAALNFTVMTGVILISAGLFHVIEGMDRTGQ
jgi:hypothetical protein